MKKLIANLARLVYTGVTRKELPPVESSNKSEPSNNYRYKVAYDPLDQMYWAYENKGSNKFPIWIKIRNTWSNTHECTEGRLKSYLVQLEMSKNTETYY